MYKGFPVTEIYCCCNHCSFIYKTVSQFFEILFFSQDVWGNVHNVCVINLIPKKLLGMRLRLMIKAAYLLSKTKEISITVLYMEDS